ncbi:nucleotidyltransferase domain-containing protein [Tersicoccus phoenicis]|uniref:nucleotidyltransferase domain-containing protein n=1 Tax=Tersicoccus phoenicis TaxID=554083 RepID=UPI0013563FDB|nr:nucleotidyltransferase domain-containing protein [Tersicoccus phoenicis]
MLVQPAGRASLYRLNREHLAAPAIIELARLGDTLRERIAERIEGWAEQPVYAALFGSGARGEMTAASDLDLFILRSGGASEARYGPDR